MDFVFIDLPFGVVLRAHRGYCRYYAAARRNNGRRS